MGEEAQKELAAVLLPVIQSSCPVRSVKLLNYNPFKSAKIIEMLTDLKLL